MDLVTRLFADRRDRLLMKVGCCLVCISLVLALMLPQQRAYAVEPVTMTVVASLAVAYFGACGLTFITQNMDKDALVSSVQRLLQEFLDTELGGISIQDWLGTVWDVAVLTGKIIMGRPLTNELMGFAQWVAGKYAAQVGENVVYSGVVINYADGSLVLSQILDKSLVGPAKTVPPGSFVLGTPMAYGNSRSDCPVYQFSPGYTLRCCYNVTSSGKLECNIGVTLGDDSLFWGGSSLETSDFPFYLVADSVYLIPCKLRFDGYLFTFFNNFCIPLSHVDGYTGETSVLGLDREKESLLYIPDGIEADQDIALDVGASPTMDLSQILQQVLEDVLAGTLTSSMEIADAEDVPVDPPAGEITDVDGLGLPALGAALTTRFPFSIPWDISRAVQLLAAPAKTPYFEVDFFEPISDLVGGWKGSTKIVLDFSQYEIIGQVSRWTSTIGFCLMLAGSTKRLIWTA